MTAILAPLATATSPAVGTTVYGEFVGRHVDDGLIAHWAPNTTKSYYVHTTCGLVGLSTAYFPFAAEMAVCPACFDPRNACPWCKTHCDEQLRWDHQFLTGWARGIGRPTLMPDGSLRPAPVELRVVA